MIRCELTRKPACTDRKQKTHNVFRPGPVVVHEPLHVSLTSFPTRRSNYACKKIKIKKAKSHERRGNYTQDVLTFATVLIRTPAAP